MVDTIFELVSPACYFEQIEPAVAVFRNSGNPEMLVGLLRKGQGRLRDVQDDKHPYIIAGERFDFIQDALNVIEGREFYRPSTNHVPLMPGDQTTRADLKDFIERHVYGFLFTSLCVALEADIPAQLVLTRGRLLPYLYEHSTSLEYAFTCGGLRGDPLPLFPESELLSREVVADLLQQIESVPVSDDSVEGRKAQTKWEALQKTGGAIVSSQFADVFGPPVSLAIRDLKNLLAKSLGDPNLAIVQRFG